MIFIPIENLVVNRAFIGMDECYAYEELPGTLIHTMNYGIVIKLDNEKCRSATQNEIDNWSGPISPSWADQRNNIMSESKEEILARMSEKDRKEYLARMEEDRIAKLNEPIPYGFKVAKEEWDKVPWHKDRPYTLNMWKELTFKDQQYYGEIEAAKDGQSIKVNVTESIFQIEIKIPEEFRNEPLSASETASFKHVLEREAKKNAYWLMVARRNGWNKSINERYEEINREK